ncbi:MAG: carbon starvation protein A [Chlamydiota bacterium]|nr:carbon starvation protein A [Chlamydiota bacterium]
MNSLIIALIMIGGYVLAYHSYGHFLAKKIFRIDPSAICPSKTLQDDVDYVPTQKHVLFGHHFTSIAGLGPIVGPAIAVIWGWLPAVIWVFFGSIFMGAVHDFGSLIISLRKNGRSIGDLASDIINPRVRTLFLLIIFFALIIVIAVFALIIAILFGMYPESIIPIWLQIPIAVYLGHLIYQKGKKPLILGLGAVFLMYLTIGLGVFYPLKMPSFFGFDPLSIWIIILLSYAYIASTLPVQTLLQPRDYINSFQLMIAMGLLGLGTLIAHPPYVAPMLDLSPKGAPPMLPFLFVIIACGAISGFHCLISSGTSSKQCSSEKDAKFIGYGGMLMEGTLSALVIVAVCAGIGLELVSKDGTVLTGAEAFRYHYASWSNASGLSSNLHAFITGSANLIESMGIEAKYTLGIMGVFLVSFAATTMDSATRIQRYVIHELAGAWKIPTFQRKHPATFLAVLTALVLAFCNGSPKGALTLWPLFGCVNQLLAGLALLVITIYLAKQRIPSIYASVPMIFMITMTAWAMVLNLIEFFKASNWLLFIIGLMVFSLEIWMIIESALVIKKVYASQT